MKTKHPKLQKTINKLNKRNKKIEKERKKTASKRAYRKIMKELDIPIIG